METAVNKFFPASILALLLAATTAQAHNLEVECKIDRDRREVTVKCFYETGEPPKKATARVRRDDGSVLIEGKVDPAGLFTFRYEKAEALSVHVEAEGGHKGVYLLKAADLGKELPPDVSPTSQSSRARDLLLGVALVLATAAFVMSWWNGRRLKRLEELLQRRA